MGDDPILRQFDRLGVWGRGDERAPHKPLLVLYALARWARGERGDVPFSDVDRDLTLLLKEFGPFRKAYHPEYPFWWLRSDGVWAVRSDESLGPFGLGAGPTKGALLARDVRAGFSDEVKAALADDPALVARIAALLLDRHFPESIHPDILSAVGLSLGEGSAVGRGRDPSFRQKVMTAYEWRCAVCGFDIRLGSTSIALDAAHIKWHQAGGPAEEVNGLALCALHHKTFDLGAFTLDEEGTLLVSDQANGTTGLHESLLCYHGRPVRPPQRPGHRPHSDFVGWHRREVFKGDPRHVDRPL